MNEKELEEPEVRWSEAQKRESWERIFGPGTLSKKLFGKRRIIQACVDCVKAQVKELREFVARRPGTLWVALSFAVAQIRSVLM